MSRKFITTIALNQCLDLRIHGFTWRACGEMLGYDRSSLRRASLRAGMPSVYHPLKPGALAEARSLREQGVCWKTVGRMVGHNWRTLAQRICEENRNAGR